MNDSAVGSQSASSIVKARFSMACEEEGPNQHRIQIESFKVHWRDDQVWSFFQSRHVVLYEATFV